MIKFLLKLGPKKKDKVIKKQSTAQISNITTVHKQNCRFCIKVIADEEEFVCCYTRHKAMHCICWDPDTPAQIHTYLAKANDTNACIHIYCATCAISSNHS